MDLPQSVGDRSQVAKHVGGENAVKRVVGKRQVFPNGYDPPRQRVERQHLGHRIESNYLPVSERRSGRPGSGTQIEQPAGRKSVDAGAPPGLLAPERQDSIESVVASRDPCEDFLALRPPTHGAMTSKPTYGRSAAGILTDPSAC